MAILKSDEVQEYIVEKNSMKFKNLYSSTKQNFSKDTDKTKEVDADFLKSILTKNFTVKISQEVMY